MRGMDFWIRNSPQDGTVHGTAALPAVAQPIKSEPLIYWRSTRKLAELRSNSMGVSEAGPVDASSRRRDLSNLDSSSEKRSSPLDAILQEVMSRQLCMIPYAACGRPGISMCPIS